MNTFEQQISDQRLEQVREDILLAKKSLLGGKVVIPEGLFIKFLPLFSGEILPPKTNITIPSWIAIAGGPSLEVDVAGADGKILFTVPAMAPTNLEIDPSFDLSSVINVFNLESNGIRHVAVNNFNQGLAHASAGIKPNQSEMNKNIALWKIIFDRYGIKDPYQTEQKATLTTLVADEELEDA